MVLSKRDIFNIMFRIFKYSFTLSAIHLFFIKGKIRKIKPNKTKNKKMLIHKNFKKKCSFGLESTEKMISDDSPKDSLIILKVEEALTKIDDYKIKKSTQILVHQQAKEESLLQTCINSNEKDVEKARNDENVQNVVEKLQNAETAIKNVENIEKAIKKDEKPENVQKAIKKDEKVDNVVENIEKNINAEEIVKKTQNVENIAKKTEKVDNIVKKVGNIVEKVEIVVEKAEKIENAEKKVESSVKSRRRRGNRHKTICENDASMIRSILNQQDDNNNNAKDKNK
ncbi:hypothetical protein EDEG_00395 [Edhazardia aedis USNM 41457]|uniref:Uncharacterized protein n=1 Tax=Edhazardia aedis (strain USNM 41457) TaxID=1003232 RepID=J8ZPR2_EDHAE|nr:hypothetical protein EDEG_00395 [Edhazardia aedis USNM 41457]|eukprot:EJW01678.1 hypothetical protein EDEG_00395 [Edhazardia aedis USNM 41457]